MSIHATLIAENYAGHLSQGRGLVERAGYNWDFQPVIFKNNRLMSQFCFRSGFRILEQIEPVIISPQTNLIISMAGKGGRVAAFLGKKYKIPVVQIQDPRRTLKDYALVIANEHDGLTGDKVVTIRTALHGVTDEKLMKARQKWQEIIRGKAGKVLGVLLGGSNGRYVFGPKEAAFIAEQIKSFITLNQMSCVITCSRRTAPGVVSLLKILLGSFDVRFLNGEGEENPYLGILACSDCLSVTEDSVSMISEAVATTVPVGILPLSGRSLRLKSFVEGLEKAGRVSSFGVNMSLTLREKLDDTPLAVEKMKQLLMVQERQA